MSKSFLAGITKFSGSLGPRQVEAVINTPAVDLAGDIVEPSGCQMRGSSVILLANHDPSKPIGRAEIRIGPGAVRAFITFAPEGISHHADEFCGLAKAGVLTDLSVGFDPIESEPIAGSPGARRYTKWQLLELSVVSVGCNQEAVITARSISRSGRVLSGANAEKLRQAHDAAESCRAMVAEVLEAGGAGTEPDADDQAQQERHRRQRRASALGLAPGAASDPDRERRQRRARVLAVSA